MATDLDRVQRVIAEFSRQLGKEFYQNNDARREMVSITERAPVGTRWPDGQKFRLRGGATGRQVAMIVDTSATDAEAVDRLRQLVMEGIDTTRVVAKDVDIEDRVRREVARILEQMNRDIEAEKQGVKQQITERIEERKPSRKVPRAVQGDEPELTDEMRLWADRARTLGMPELKINGSGNIDGRWLRRVRDRWAAATSAPTAAE